MDIQYGGVHAPCIKCNSVDDRVSVGYSDDVLARVGGACLWIVVDGCCTLGVMFFRVKNLSSVGWVWVVGMGGYYVAWCMGRGRPC